LNSNGHANLFLTFCLAEELLTIFEIMFGGWKCGQVFIPFVIFTGSKGHAGLFSNFV
jgi:hypothetical protein